MGTKKRGWWPLALALAIVAATATMVGGKPAGAETIPSALRTEVTSACSYPMRISVSVGMELTGPGWLADAHLTGVLSTAGRAPVAFAVGAWSLTSVRPTSFSFLVPSLRAPVGTYSVQWQVTYTDGGTYVLGHGVSHFPAPACPPVVAIGAASPDQYMVIDADGAVAGFGIENRLALFNFRTLFNSTGVAAATAGPSTYVTDSYAHVLNGAVILGRFAAAPKQPVVAIAVTPTGRGYWLATSAGGIMARGDAHRLGSAIDIRLNHPIVAITRTPSGRGYWLVASDGGVFSFGSAHFYGSTGNIRLQRPIVAAAATPTGRGYWLVASDGGVFTFGDAHFYGSTGARTLTRPVVGIAPTPSGRGYWLVTSNGKVFNFGDAHFHGAVE